VFSLGQPLLTVLLTVGAAASLVLAPGTSAPASGSSEPQSSLLAALPQPTPSRSLILPGQSTPELTLQVGPGMPAADSRVIRLHVGGRERGYLLLPPLGLPRGQLAALAVVLHQDVGSARAVAQGLGLDALRRRGIALAYPAGVGGSWNAGGCCGVAQDQDVDDVSFINAVFDDVGRHVPIDRDRRALVGYSGGGMLAYRVLCSAHPALAAAVEVSGALEAHCPSGVRLPDLLSVHGELDGTVGLTKPIHVTHLGMSPRTVESTLTIVTQQAACGKRRTTDLPDMRDVRWSGCRGGSSIDLQIVLGAGHGWESVHGAERAVPFLLDHLVRAA
jgi:polyhydroxybutyrate depolymerase